METEDKLQLYVVAPFDFTDAAGKPVTEDRLLEIPEGFEGVDFNKMPEAVRRAVFQSFKVVYVDPATLSTNCGGTLTPPTDPDPDPTPNPNPDPVSVVYGIAQLTESGVIFRIGPDAAATVRLVEWPVGYENYSQTYDMKRAVDQNWAELKGKDTFYVKAYDQTPAGRYVARIIQGGKTYYAAVIRQASQSALTAVLTFYEQPPPAEASLGDMSWVVNAARQATGRVVASGAVQITPPRLDTAAATGYVDIGMNGDAYEFTTDALPTGTYVGKYQLKSGGPEKPYSFTVAKALIQQVDFAYQAPSADYSLGRWQLWLRSSYADTSASVQTSELTQQLSPLTDINFNFYRQEDQNGQREETFILKLTGAGNTVEDQISLKQTLGTDDIVRRTIYDALSPAVAGDTSIVYADSNLGGKPTILFRLQPVWNEDGSRVRFRRTYAGNVPNGHQEYWTFDKEGLMPDPNKAVNPYQGRDIENVVWFPPNYNVDIECFWAQGAEVNRGYSSSYCSAIGKATIYTGTKPIQTT